MGSWLFGSQSSPNTVQPPASSLRIQTSMQGRPISILWGTQRIAGNLLYQGNFQAVAQYTSTGSNSWLGHIFTKAQTTQTGYLYYVDAAFALCYGTTTGNGALRAWNGTASNTIGGYGFSVAIGDQTQTYNAQDPSPVQLGYRGISYAVQYSWNVGSDPSLPIINFEVSSANCRTDLSSTLSDCNPRDVIIDALVNPYYGLKFPITRVDMQMAQYSTYCAAANLWASPILIEQTSASQFISDLLKGTNSAARWSSGKLTVVPWGSGTITTGSNASTSAVITVPTPSSGFPRYQIAVQTFYSDGGVAYYPSGTPLTNITFGLMPSVGEYSVSPQGLYYFAVADEGLSVEITYTYNSGWCYQPGNIAIYDLGADDFLPLQGSMGTGSAATGEPIVCVRKRKSDMLNQIKVEYLDRTSNYDPVALDAKDDASIYEYGIRPSSLNSRHFFCYSAAAQQSAYLELNRNQIAETFMFTLPPKYILLDVEDIVTITRPTMGLSQKAVRIIEIQENSDYSLTITAEEFLGTATASAYGTETTTQNNQNFNIDPGLAIDAIIFDPPSALASPAATEIPVWIAVCGSIPDNLGGFYVWYSTDNASYSQIGSTLPAKMGFLSATLASHTDPDTVNTCSVDAVESAATLPDGNATNYALGIPACWVDSEVIAYQNKTITGTYTYDLTTLRRALYSTTAASHAVGSPFCVLDDTIFKITVPTSLSGITIYFKFQPYNIYGGNSPDLSTLLAYPYVVASNPTASWPYPIPMEQVPQVFAPSIVYVDDAVSAQPIPVADM